MGKKIGIAIVLILIAIQFIRIDKESPKLDVAQDFITTEHPPQNVEDILRSSCYDCHSNETKYPWYANVAPISIWIGHHIEEGREHLNFSEWGTYTEEEKEHKLEECYEEVEEKEMPLGSYTWTHKEARFSDETRELLEKWFKEQYLNKYKK